MADTDNVFKVVLIGDAGTGKTHLLNRYVKGAIPKATQPTIGVEFATKTVKISEEESAPSVKVQFWDTAGQERYRSITASHYRKSIGALLVYDITKEATYDNVQKWMEELKLQAEPNIVIMLVGNKLDEIDKDEDKRKVQFQEAANFAKENNLEFIETSALTAKNVNEAFQQLIKKIYDVKNQLPGGKENNNQKLTQQLQEENNGNKGCQC